MPHGKKAASKTPMDAYADGCRATSISTGHPTRRSRRSSSPPTSRPVNASASRRLSKLCLPSLERMCKSGSLNPVALRSGIQGVRDDLDNRDYFLDLGRRVLPDVKRQLKARKLTPKFAKDWGVVMMC